LKFHHQTKNSLIYHGESIAIPVGKYFNTLLNVDGGHCYNIRKLAKASQIFNPIFLADKTSTDIVTILHFLADKLVHFGYNHFTPTFIYMLKKEMPELVKEANRDSDLGRLKVS